MSGSRSSLLRMLLAACLVQLIQGSWAAIGSTKPSLISTSETVTADPKSLLEAVRLLLSEVSDLKDENRSLRRDVNQARREISSLQEHNEALTDDIKLALQQKKAHLRTVQQPPQSQSQPQPQKHRRSKLRGTPDTIIPVDHGSSDSALKDRLEALEDKLACVSDDSTIYDIYFEGCNVHVRDGSGATEGTGSHVAEQSGRGNVIIGYNEKPGPDDDAEPPELCSNSSATDFASCRQTGGVWGTGLQMGIHNLVVGAGHSYTQHSGIVAGTSNGITGIGAVVLGGRSNVASGDFSSVSGGVDNIASGKTSVVLGGFDNTASGDDSLVGGGSYNTAGGSGSAVVGGENNLAMGEKSFIAGGSMNRMMGEYSCSTGSFATVATGREAAITGGRGVVAALDETLIAGELFDLPVSPDPVNRRLSQRQLG